MTRSNLLAFSAVVALVLLASCGSTDTPGSAAATTTTRRGPDHDHDHDHCGNDRTHHDPRHDDL